MTERTAKPLVLTMGDPAGIGPETAAMAWRALRETGPVFAWAGDPSCLPEGTPVRELLRIGEAAEVFSEALPVLPLTLEAPVIKGQPDVANAPAVIESILRATSLAQVDDAAALVTCPISKAVLKQAGFPYPGHTEFLAEICRSPGSEVMMLAAPELRVVPVTVHVALRDAISMLTTVRIVEVARTTAEALKTDFGLENPRLAVAGLNPHAGEQGTMGREEEDIIIPAVRRLREEGIAVAGPLPPDTMFTPAARETYDAAICMYHDQALIPLKTLNMDEGVNVTLGLPVVRTSPDHGTAFDIAGKGTARPDSLIAALRLADTLGRRRAAGQG